MAYNFSVEERIDMLTSFPGNLIFFAIFIYVTLFVYVKTKKKKRAFRVCISLISSLAFCVMMIFVVAYATSGAHGGI